MNRKLVGILTGGVALAMSLSADAMNVYYDNSATMWNPPLSHYWGGTPASLWPGVEMTATQYPNIWCIEIPDDSTGVLFHQLNGGKTEDLVPVADYVYTFSGDSGKTLYEYLNIDIPEPGEMKSYTVSFHNNLEWRNIHVEITGPSFSEDGVMASFLNSVIYDYTFEAPEGYPLSCRFYTLSNGNREQLTSYFTLIDGHVYTVSGDKGLKSEYDPNNTLPEAEYWLEPATPGQNDRATLYFNRAFNNNGPLRHSDDICLYSGLVPAGEEDTVWKGGNAGNWANYGDKYKMTQSASNPDLFSISFTPSIAGWYGVDTDASYDRMALIFRNSAGTKQHEEDLFLPLSYTAPSVTTLGRALDWEEKDDNTIEFTCEKGVLRLTPWSDEVVKVFTLPSNAATTEERESISVITPTQKERYGISSARFDVTETDSEYFLRIPEGVAVKVEKESSLLSFYNPDKLTSPVLMESGGLVNKPGNVSVTFAGMSDIGFYGGGYNGNLVNWDGHTMTMNNNQGGNWGQGASTTRNICVPYYVSTSGYGVYFDDHYRYATIRPSKFGSSYKSSSQNPIAYYFVGGGSMERAMQNYTSLTGKQELPPYWALGYITSKFSFATREEAEQTIAKTKAVNIPIDGIVFDIHWQTGSYLGTGTARMGRIDWERSAYPDPEGMMRNFRAQHVHTIAITEPYFTSNSYNYDFMKERGYLADDNVSNMSWLQSDRVGLIDVTNNDAVEWYKSLYKARTAEGIESWWLDLGEPESHDDDSMYQGGSVSQVHNEYGNRWLELAYTAMKEQSPDTRFILMPRAGTSGLQRFNSWPWTGDIARSWGGLAAQVPALVSAAMSGISYLGSDIGGFIANGPNADLYRRWVQLGVFYPSMRTHSATEPEVWRDAYASVRDDVRNAINLRYAYLPYTYSQAFAYTLEGTPIARPANYADNDKSVLDNEIGAYLWGPDIYVAPVLDQSTSKSIRFPEGDWLDMSDFRTVYAGHSSINYNAPKSLLPRFMRRGSFVPRYRQDTFTSTEEADRTRLTVDHFAPKVDEEGYGFLYDDDHQTVDPFDDEKYVLTHFRSHNVDNSYLLIDITREGQGWEGMEESRDIQLRIHDFHITNEGEALESDQVAFVMDDTEAAYAGGKHRRAEGTVVKMTKAGSENEVLAASTPAYYHDVEGGKIHLRIPDAHPMKAMTISVGHNDMETGVASVSISETMTLSYGGGMLTYSAGEGITNLRIEIHTSTGMLVKTISGLKADGYAAQIDPALGEGVYVARLLGRDSSGAEKSRVVKLIVD